MEKVIIGCEEWLSIKDLNIPIIKARVDSGAKTSSLHAYNINQFQENGKNYVRFDIHPIQNDRTTIQNCRGLVVDKRNVKSSSGNKEQRIVIKTPITLGGETWEIEVTLTNRDSMGYRMLIGRQAMTNRVLIDPDSSFCLGTVSIDEVKKHYSTVNIKFKKDGLRIILLASNPELYTNKRLMEVGKQRGHKIRFVDIKQCYMNITSASPEVYYRGGLLLTDVDAIIPRIRP